MPRSRPPYPPEYRRRMVGLVRSGRTPEELSREFEATAQSIRNWVEQADLDEGLHSDGLTTAVREELRRLRRENRQLREEREILGGTILLRFHEERPVRRVPLQAQALEIMRELARTRRRVGVDHVFARRDGRKAKAIHVSWGHARELAGLLEGGRRFRWHDLRVSAATWLAENGATVFDLMLIFGWKTPAMAARYVRMTDRWAAALVAATTSKLLGSLA